MIHVQNFPLTISDKGSFNTWFIYYLGEIQFYSPLLTKLTVNRVVLSDLGFHERCDLLKEKGHQGIRQSVRNARETAGACSSVLR